MATNFNQKCEILGELWIKYKNQESFTDFVTYNDLGLPLAYSISSGIVEKTPKSEAFINETWDILLTALDMPEAEYSSLEELLNDEFPDMGLLGDEE